MSDEHTRPDANLDAELPEWLQEVTEEAREKAPAADRPVQQRISTSSVVMMLGVLVVIALLGYAMIERERQRNTPKSGPAPDFEVTMFDYAPMVMSGETVSLESLRGQAIVINFWASYCVPCQQEAPMLERLWREYRDQGVIFLGINTEDPLKEALDYLARYGITYPNAPDNGARMETAYRITGIPETFVINTKGEIVQHFLSEPNERDFRASIERALSE